MCCDTNGQARIEQLEAQIDFLQKEPRNSLDEMLTRELIDKLNSLKPKIKKSLPPPPTYPSYVQDRKWVV